MDTGACTRRWWCVGTAVALSLAFTLVASCTGPAGPVGPRGEAGEDGVGKVYQQTGILYSTTMDTVSDSWDVPCWFADDSTIVQVYVRAGAGHMWSEPTWFRSDGWVRIFDDQWADPSDEYIITGMVAH